MKRSWLAGLALAGLTLASVVALTTPLGPARPTAEAVSSRRAEISPSTVATSSPSPTATPLTTPSPRPPVGLEVGNLAPDFTLPSLEDGAPITLSGYAGHPVWLNFWAPSCPACLTEMPRLEGLWLDRRGAGLVILGVGIRDSADDMRRFARLVGVDYPLVVDVEGTVAALYRVIALPVHFGIDRAGIVRGWAFGELPPDVLEAAVDELMAEPRP